MKVNSYAAFVRRSSEIYSKIEVSCCSDGRGTGHRQMFDSFTSRLRMKCCEHTHEKKMNAALKASAYIVQTEKGELKPMLCETKNKHQTCPPAANTKITFPSWIKVLA